MAAIGLLPAAISTGIGSESQKPLATVVIGGSGNLYHILPILYAIAHKILHRRKNIEKLHNAG